MATSYPEQPCTQWPHRTRHRYAPNGLIVPGTAMHQNMPHIVPAQQDVSAFRWNHKALPRHIRCIVHRGAMWLFRCAAYRRACISCGPAKCGPCAGVSQPGLQAGATHPQSCLATGPGLTHATVGVPAKFRIISKDLRTNLRKSGKTAMAPYHTTWHSMAWYVMPWHGNSMTWYSTAWHGTA